VAVDVIALMDALGIEKAILAGFDWGARSADVVAALWPERCTALVSVSGYLIGSQAANETALPPRAEYAWWYQYYFAAERGRAGYATYRREFANLIWQLAAPKWAFDDATFARSAAAFDNPDHVAIVIHNSRGRLALAAASRNTTNWNGGWLPPRPSPCPRSPSRATPTAHHTPIPAPMPANSPASTSTGPFPAASGTTCPRKPRRLSPRRSPTPAA
jgi:pimeloyl-ACP methyl ester carboxylesterase